MYCWFGLSLIGAISVPINTAYKRDEASYILNNAGASALVTHTSLLDVAREAAGLAPERAPQVAGRWHRAGLDGLH